MEAKDKRAVGARATARISDSTPTITIRHEGDVVRSTLRGIERATDDEIAALLGELDAVRAQLARGGVPRVLH